MPTPNLGNPHTLGIAVSTTSCVTTSGSNTVALGSTGYFQSSGATTVSGSNVITLASAPSTNPTKGMSISGTGIPIAATVTGYNSITLQVTLSANATTSGTATMTFSNVHAGMSIVGTGIPANAIVWYLSSTNVVISANATASGTVTMTFKDPNFAQILQFNGFQGQLVSDVYADFIFSQQNDQATTIDFGQFVAYSTQTTCKAPAADTDRLIGLSVRRFKQSELTTGIVNYAQYDEVSILREAPGMIWVPAAEGVLAGDVCVSLTASNGTVGGRNLLNGNYVATAAAGGANTGNGTFVKDSTAPLQTNYQDGVYTLTCTSIASSVPSFTLQDPAGNTLSILALSGSGSGSTATFINQIKGVVTQGSTAFAVGDYFTLTVNAGRVAAQGKGNIYARWVDTVAPGNIGRVQIQSL